jgi:hypothetical protein
MSLRIVTRTFALASSAILQTKSGRGGIPSSRAGNDKNEQLKWKPHRENIEAVLPD